MPCERTRHFDDSRGNYRQRWLTTYTNIGDAIIPLLYIYLNVGKLISERSSGPGGSCDSEFRGNMGSVLFFLEF